MSMFEELTATGINLYGGPYYDGSPEYAARMLPDVGHEAILRDGRKFRFVKSSADIPVGGPVFVEDPVDSLDVASATSAGSVEVELDTSGVDLAGDGAGVVAQGFLAGGILVIQEGDSAGTYGIKASSAGTASVDVKVTLDRPLPAALTTSNDVFVVTNKYAKAKSSGSVCIGFAVRAFTGSTNSREEYGWIQTGGIGSVRIETNTNIAAGASLKVGTTGLVVPNAHTDEVVAISLAAAADITNNDVAPAKICC